MRTMTFNSQIVAAEDIDDDIRINKVLQQRINRRGRGVL
jgi:hypothetical protein